MEDGKMEDDKMEDDTTQSRLVIAIGKVFGTVFMVQFVVSMPGASSSKSEASEVSSEAFDDLEVIWSRCKFYTPTTKYTLSVNTQEIEGDIPELVRSEKLRPLTTCLTFTAKGVRFVTDSEGQVFEEPKKKKMRTS